MKIKTRLEINAIFLVCGLLVIALTLFFSFQQINEAMQQYMAADEIVQSTFELNIITGDYLLHQEKRAQSQWYLKHDSLSKYVTDLEIKDLEDQSVLDNIAQNNQDIEDIFSQLVTSYEGQELSEGETALQGILQTQLSVKLQDMVSGASLLCKAAQERELTVIQTSNLIITVSIIVLTAVMGANSILIIKSIAQPLTKLHEGVEKITRGNLNHKVGSPVKDEIGQLSRAFDQMTASLKITTASRDELNKEITKRKQTEKLLREAERFAAIGETATMVGHDLRNPLQAIRFAEYNLRKKLQKDTSQLKSIRSSIQYADQAVNNLLDFSQDRSLIAVRVNLSSLMNEALEMLQIPGNVKAVNKIGEQLDVYVDPNLMKRVFVNIVLNAVQAMPKGGTLTLKTRSVGKHIEISFKDTGTGIAKKDFSKIFDPFFTTKSKGLGLGLPIVKKVVERYEGTISVESQVGKGTTFTVRLPKSREKGGEKR